MTAAIEARGLSKRFGPLHALRALDLRLEAGDALAVLGPNGAGKSTLLRLLAGLARPTSGDVRVGGAETRRERRRRVGLVAHATFLYGALSARENLWLAGRLFGVPDADARIETLLARLGLGGAAERRVEQLSRGMRQRLAIARALVHEPAVLLLDEPFTGLDPAGRHELIELLHELGASGQTLVLVTHDLDLVPRLARRALLLRAGRARDLPSEALADAEALGRAYAEATREVGA